LVKPASSDWWQHFARPRDLALALAVEFDRAPPTSRGKQFANIVQLHSNKVTILSQDERWPFYTIHDNIA